MAAQQGLTESLGFLIDEKGFAPFACYEGKALFTHACENEHEKTVCLLAQKLTQFQRTLPYGFTPLHEAAKVGFKDAAKIILSKAPTLLDIQSREGATALFLGVQGKHKEFVQFLLENAADPNRADANGLTPVGMACLSLNPDILSLLLQYGASPVLSTLAQQNRLLHSLVNVAQNPNKLKCLNLMFAAGAGLELSHIPDDLLKIYNIKRSQLKDFLVLGKQKDADGVFITRLLTSIEQLEAAISDPNWQFEYALLSRACQHPTLQHLPHVKRIQKCLKTKVPPQQALDPRPVVDEESIMQSLEEIQMMGIEELGYHFEAEQSLLKNFNRSIDFILMELTLREPTFSYEDPLLLNLVTQSLKCFERISQLSHNNKFKHLMCNKKYVLDLGLEEFNIFMLSLNSSFLMRQQLPQGADKLVHILDEKLRAIIKYHGEALKSANPSFYNSIVEAQGIVCARLGRWYLQQGKKEVAISLSLEALQYIERIDVNNPSLEASVAHDKAVCLTTSMQVYMDLGWTNKAGRQAATALSLFRKSSTYDNLLPQLVLQLADVFAEKNRLSKAFSLLDDTIRFLDKAFTFNHEESFEAMTLTAKLKEKLTALKQSHFTQRAQSITTQLQTFCQIEIDQKLEKIKITINTTKLHPENLALLAKFLSKNKSIFGPSENQMLLNSEFVFSKAFSVHIAELRNILSMPRSVPKEVDDDLAATFKSLSLEKSPVPKLMGTPATAKEIPEETYGFKKPAGFTKIVPIYSERLPHNALFLTIPEDNPQFTPFYKLVRDEHKTKYFPVHAVAGKGKNQHGVKLGTSTITQPNKTKEKIAWARLKVSGTERAHGYVEQTVRDEKGKERKLYVFREVVEKKKEERKNYKM